VKCCPSGGNRGIDRDKDDLPVGNGLSIEQDPAPDREPRIAGAAPGGSSGCDESHCGHELGLEKGTQLF
jgi:hypothetical protein